MKVMGRDRIVNKFDQFDYRTALCYVLSLPVTSATVSHPRPEYLDQNLDVVRTFQPYNAEEMQKLKTEAAEEIRVAFTDFMRHHSDFA